ncbi:hypothetical protein C8R46DRAFT_1222674 [Mycena filopes]|nr:hypothetical protein C8R46DRAFT_1222674 [Mycena filopes]
MCRTGTGDFNLSQESLTSPEALALLRTLNVDHPALYQEFTQGKRVDAVAADSTPEEEAYSEPVEDDCDVPVKVLAEHIASGSAVVAANFAVNADGGLVGGGNAEMSDAEEEEEVPKPLGRGKRTRVTNRFYTGPAWEEH